MPDTPSLPEIDTLPDDWKAALDDQWEAPYFAQLTRFVADERARHDVFPAQGDVLAALRRTPLGSVRAVILGQDPYPTPGHAHGLAFSVTEQTRPIPASLRNVFAELQADLGVAKPSHGSLLPWADRGVLLLNAALTVRSGEPKSHAGKGWERFTDAAIRAVAARPERVVFLLWGKDAQAKADLVGGAHTVLKAPHPSPLARNPATGKAAFLGSRPFSQANDALVAAGRDPIDWTLP